LVEKYNIPILLLMFLLSNLVLSGIVTSGTSYSSNYGISTNVFGSGTNKSSDNYRLSDVFEETIVGNATSNNYNSFFGFIFTREIKITSGAFIEITLNATKFWWNDGVNVSVLAKRATQDPISNGNIVLRLESVDKCVGITNSEGGYSCVFDVPKGIGTYNLIAQVTDPLNNITHIGSTIVDVRFEYGDTDTGKNVGCYNTPRLIENPDGSVRIVMIRICVWK
jgi:hypothetical protein